MAALSVLGSLACLLTLTALFALLGPLLPVDVYLQLHLHAFASPWLDRIMLALTWIGSIKIFASALAVVVVGLLAKGHRHAAALLTYAITGALLLNEGLKQLFHRARPVLPWSILDEHTYSYPSGHSLFSVTLYGTLCWLALRHGTSAWRVVPLALALPLAIGTSRIYLGEHYPTDVLAGWLSGTLWTATVIVIDRGWTRQLPGAPPSRS